MTLLAKLIRSKIVAWIAIVLPGLWPAWPFFVRQDPSALADPLKFILHHLGFVACILLVTVLSFTPLRVLFPKSPVVQALNRHRRLVGVSAAVYALLHFATHLIYEGGTDPKAIPSILHTAVTKPFQLVGLIALAILLVLAVTSLHVFVRWLGGKNWKNLHRLAYVAAPLVAYHQALARKVFPPQVLWIFVPLAVLEVLRIITERSRAAARRKAVPAAANAVAAAIPGRGDASVPQHQ
ncbi:MAG TPA: ferric reductase-like transmembrane domain-containing protein [Opitutaceae bacterium]|nr:ferric reductase-like transmembrane domain-containing protein [Opitutaceae bacterium]